MLWKHSKGPSAHCVCVFKLYSSLIWLVFWWCLSGVTGLCCDNFHASHCAQHKLPQSEERKKKNDQKGRYLWKTKSENDVSSPPPVVGLWSSNGAFPPFQPGQWEGCRAWCRHLQRAFASLSVQVRNSDRLPLYTSALRDPPTAQQLSFHQVRGVTLFPPWTLSLSLFQLMHDGCILASEWVAFIVHSSGFLLLRKGRWIQNQHLNKTLFF